MSSAPGWSPPPFDNDAIPVGNGWRASWSDQCTVGAGFHREISTPAPAAILYKPLDQAAHQAADAGDEGTLVCNRIEGIFKMLESSSEMSQLFSAGGTITAEGWGASGSATVRHTEEMKLSSNSLTVVVSMRYMSDPMIMINPSNVEQEVTLTPAAIHVLETLGPEEFHRRYGTHYIAGYIKGGFLIGSYSMVFKSKAAAEENSGEIKAGFESAKISAELTANFEKKVAEIDTFKHSAGQYFCRGWTKNTLKKGGPPDLACSLEALVAAHDAFNIENGVKIAAVLRSYHDIPQYDLSRQVFDASMSTAYEDNFVSADSYGFLVDILSKEYARLIYLSQFIKEDIASYDLDTQAIMKAQRETVRTAMRRFKQLLTERKASGRTIDEIRKTMKGLEAYLVLWEGRKPSYQIENRDGVLVDNPEYATWESGYNTLYSPMDGLFAADNVEKILAEYLPQSKGAPPKDLGTGWTINTSDGNLHFQYNGQNVFILHNKDNGYKVWSVERGPMSDNSLGNGWALNTSDGHLRAQYWGQQKMVVHNGTGGEIGTLWSEKEGWIDRRR